MSELLEVTSIYRSYSVNKVNDLQQAFRDLLRDTDFFIVDRHVLELFSDDIKPFLNHPHIIVEPSEEAKSFQKIEPILSELIEGGFKKNHRLIAIGGGITQDITSFCASILYRGVEWLFFPTTLLAQCDSCIGSKTSINFASYKNQLGTFYPPAAIYIYAHFLTTLGEAEMRSGFGEMMHFYFIGGEQDFDYIEKNYENILQDHSAVVPFVKRSLEIKKTLAEIDEFDKKERRIFNYGHSFGHAIESMTSYEIQHGIAVSIGMDIANFVSMKLGFIDESLYTKMHDLLKRNRTEAELSLIKPNQLIQFLKKDKKNVDGSIRVILTRGFEKMFVHQIDDSELLDKLIQQYFDSLQKVVS